MDILAVGEGRTEVCHERGIGRHGSESSSGGSRLGKLDSRIRGENNGPSEQARTISTPRRSK
jgi:hypothetical protein